MADGRDEQRRRAHVISTLAQQQQAQQVRDDLSHGLRQPGSLKQRRRLPTTNGTRVALWRPVVRNVVLGALAALIVAGGGIVAVRLAVPARPRMPSAAKLSVSATLAHTLDLPSVAHLYCPTGMAWSPDAMSLAVVGFTSACVGSIPQTAAVGIFDVASGTLLRRVELAPLLAARNIQGSSFGVVTWSPDGQTLAMPLVLSPGGAAAGKSGAEELMGLLVIPLGGGDSDARVYVGPPRNAFDQLIWDLHAGRVASTMHDALPAALTYKWTSDGQIVPEQPARTRPAGSSTTSAFSGTPRPASAAATFSRWQSGVMAPIPAGANVSATTPPLGWYFKSRVALWSPDGRYVAPFVPIHTLLTPLSAPSPANGSSPGLTTGTGSGAGAACPGSVYAEVCAQSPAVLPDSAFAGLLTAAQAGTEPFLGPRGAFWPALSIDWSPQGNLLATIPPADTFPPAAALPISLVAPQSGQVLLKLDAPQIHRRDLNPAAGFSGDASTAWAPTGQYLAFTDWNTSQVVLWGVTTQPSA